jgi:hypothetical protein
MILGFHSKQLTERGTEIALFEYARAAENLLGHEVRIYVPARTERLVVPAMKRLFEEHFEVVFYDKPAEIACDALYVIKKGRPGRVTETTLELNHAFDDVSRPHGHRFAAVSEWLARTARHELSLPRGRVLRLPKLRRVAVVPHIVTLPDLADDLRAELRIPEEAVVFGRHGGAGNFDAPLVDAAVRAALDERADIWFAFLNTDVFYDHERIVYVPCVTDRAEIRRFVNTCDYMLHAASWGETFGMAVGEFALAGVPVITYTRSRLLAHLDLLPGELLLGYTGNEDVLQYLTTLPRRREPVGSDIATRYSVETVMAQFDEVFLR